MRCRAGLERALEARRKERQLCRYREAQGLSEAIQPELTYAVDLALAAAYQAAQLYTEALDMYGAIVKAKLVPQARWGAGGQGLGLG
jgi:intraflagellar transport protein 88